jgi:hypothetical protein
MSVASDKCLSGFIYTLSSDLSQIGFLCNSLLHKSATETNNLVIIVDYS